MCGELKGDDGEDSDETTQLHMIVKNSQEVSFSHHRLVAAGGRYSAKLCQSAKAAIRC